MIGDDRRALGVSLLRADALAQRLGAESRASRSRAIVVAGRQVADALNALLMLFADPEADARIRFDGLAARYVP